MMRRVGADARLPLVPIKEDATDVVDEMCGGYVDNDERYARSKSVSSRTGGGSRNGVLS